MRTGIFQCAVGGLSPEDRLSRLEVNLTGANLDLVVCPELFISGYDVGDELTRLAQPNDGEFAARMAELAADSSTALVYGYPERDGKVIYNSALCFDSRGKRVANHRKMMLPPGFEAAYFVPGNKTTVFKLHGMVCAILICFDVEYPEAVRSVAEAGAQVVLVPTALGNDWNVVAEKLIPTRAFENGIWLVYANHAGQENGIRYLGGSCIVTPHGEVVCRAGTDEELISSEIDSRSVRAAQARLPYLEGVRQLRKKISQYQ